MLTAPAGPGRAQRSPLLLLPGLRALQWFLLGIAVASLLNILLHTHTDKNSNLKKKEEEEREKSTEKMVALRPRFVLFGDSLTQQGFRPGGWGALLADKYARKADIILRGYSGYNSRWALHLLDKIFPKEEGGVRPAVVTVFFGANDAAISTRGSARQHVPVEEYGRNLKRIVGHVKSLSPSTQVILITPPPIDEAAREVHARTTYGPLAPDWLVERTNEVTGTYAAACKQVGKELGVPVIDLWSIFQAETNWKALLSDGLHFTPAGNEVAFESLLAAIEQLKGPHSLEWEDLPWDFPEHSDIDHANPAKTFGFLSS